MGKKMILFNSPEIIFTAFSLNNINIIMEQLVEDIDDALMDIDVETENTSTNIDLEDLGTKRRYGTDTARNQARNIFDKFLKHMKDTNNLSNSKVRSIFSIACMKWTQPINQITLKELELAYLLIGLKY